MALSADLDATLRSLYGKFGSVYIVQCMLIEGSHLQKSLLFSNPTKKAGVFLGDSDYYFIQI